MYVGLYVFYSANLETEKSTLLTTMNGVVVIAAIAVANFN